MIAASTIRISELDLTLKNKNKIQSANIVKKTQQSLPLNYIKTLISTSASQAYKKVSSVELGQTNFYHEMM